MSTIPVMSASRRTLRRASLPLAVALLFVTTVASLSIGARTIPFDEVVTALLGVGDQSVVGIVGSLRVDRTVNGLIAGSALGVSGALMQAVTRNPVADPGILGVNAGASFGIVAGLTAFGSVGAAGIVWFGLAGAGLASVVVLTFAAGRFVAGSPVRLTLAGVAFAAVLTGITQSLVLIDEDVLEVFRFWRVGSLTARSIDDSLPTLALVAAGAVLAVALAGSLNAMALGDDSARALGVRPGVIRGSALLAVALLCGSATAIVGPIAFLGLVTPHLLRAAVGPDLRILLPLSLVAAPTLLLTADVAGRVAGGGAEVPVGVLTALIGGPALIYFAVRSAKGRLS